MALLRRAGVGVAFVERDAAGGGEQLGDIEPAFVLGADDDGQLELLAVELQAGGFGGRAFSPAAELIGGGLSGRSKRRMRDDRYPAAV